MTNIETKVNPMIAIAEDGEIPLGMFIDLLLELEVKYGSTIPVLTRGVDKQYLVASCPVTINAVHKELEYEYDCNGKTYVIID